MVHQSWEIINSLPVETGRHLPVMALSHFSVLRAVLSRCQVRFRKPVSAQF
jgi:hypothetical protein